MARHLRIEFEGAIYHVTVRMIGGIGDSSPGLFRDKWDRERFLLQLAERVEAFNIRLYAYCLMNSHWHLALETPDGNLSRFMQSLTTAYTIYYNLRHHRHGHLTQGRYGAKLVEGTDYLLSLSRYIHLNPVCVGALTGSPVVDRVRHLREYPWSSYRSYIGLRKPDIFVAYGPVLVLFGRKPGVQRKAYRRFVECGIAEHDKTFMAALKASALSVGSERFQLWAQEKYLEATQPKPREDVSFRHARAAIPRERVLVVVADVLETKVAVLKQRQRNSYLRGIAACMLRRYAGMTQREIAHELEVSSGSAIGQQMRKVAEARVRNRDISRQMQRIETRLMALRKTGRNG